MDEQLDLSLSGGEIECVLFDLDETLVDTSGLKMARDAGDWPTVLDSLDKATAYAGDPHKLPAQLRAHGVSVGVVTAGARHYAEALMRRFGIAVDVLITGSDGLAPKPDPAQLLAALDELGVSAKSSAYVGDDVLDHEAAAHAGVMSVGAIWGKPKGMAKDWARAWPDLAFLEPEKVLAIDSWPRLRLSLEVTMDGSVPIFHRGSFIPHTLGLSLGRYFPTKDERAPGHPLSEALLLNKDASPNVEQFIAGVVPMLEKWGLVQGAVVTSVPSAPGAFDRFAELRHALADAVGGEDRGALLKQVILVEGYKYKSYDERAAVTESRFEASVVPRGAKVILIDDVVTSGATLGRCRDLILSKGAEVVQPITLALTQNTISSHCQLCGGVMRLMTNRIDGTRFLGCTRYRFTGCPYKVNVD